jgi:4-amino-4-deoxy-L-arabinose transferase-like glycosyltransferase
MNGIAHLIVVLSIAMIAIVMRTQGLSWPFDYDGYDEGVYWQTLRAMHSGFGLYDQVFYSQPPLFALSIYPFYVLFGQSITAARTGIAVLSLLGLLGAYMIGKALASRVGALAAMGLLVSTPIFLRQSQVLEAEGPSTAFLLLSIGAALLWWATPLGKRGIWFAILCGATFSIGVLIKLLDVTAGVPILMLILWRIWIVGHEGNPKGLSNLMPIALGFLSAAAVVLIALIPFLHTLGPLLDQVVTYHLVAKSVWHTDNLEILGRFFAANSLLAAAAGVGAFVVLIRRDWRVIPLLAWLLTSIVVLATQLPLFSRHAIILVPPLIAIAVCGIGELPAPRSVRRIRDVRKASVMGGLLSGLLVFIAALAGMINSFNYYRELSARAESNEARNTARMAADLRQVTSSDQWIITDAQFVAALADRDTPPWLVDTSHVRILTAYLTTQNAIESASNPRVHAVLFATNRFANTPTANFYDWVAERFVLRVQYGRGIELFSRQTPFQ